MRHQQRHSFLNSIFLVCLLAIITLAPGTVLAKRSKTTDTVNVLGEYIKVNMAYRILVSCDAIEPKYGERIEKIGRRQRDALYKKHSFSPAEQKDISNTFATLGKEVISYDSGIKSADPGFCEAYIEDSAKNLKLWIR